MKKTVLSTAFVLAGLMMASAQGTVKFYNISSSFYVHTNGPTSGLLASSGAAPNAYNFALLIASSPSSANPLTGGWSIAKSGGADIMGHNYSLAGSLSGTGGANGVAVDGWAPGATMSVEIVGWSANLGSTWSEIASQLAATWNTTGYYGVSLMGTVASGGVGSPASPAASIFNTTGGIASGWNLDAVAPVPEPATFALAGLGAAALLVFRRRK